MEEFLTGSRYCDLNFVCQGKLVVSAHCSVLSAVSSFLGNLLKDVYLGCRESVLIHLCEVEMEDMQHFLELVYTGKVSMGEERREQFTGLLELLNVSDDIGEKVVYQNGRHDDTVESIGGGVTLTRVNRTVKRQQATPGNNSNKKISVDITPVTPTVTSDLGSSPVVPLPIPSLAPGVSSTDSLSTVPPPVESLLATLNHQLESRQGSMGPDLGET